jgi:hypothetical protein
LAFSASHIHCNKSSIILEVELFLLKKDKSLAKIKKDLSKGKSLVIMK